MRILFAALAAAGLALAAPAGAAEFTMRVSHQVPTAHHMHKALLLFAEDVKQRTKGGVEVQLFPAEQLAKAGENFPGVARGAFEAAMSVNFQWGNTIPEMNAPAIPFFFTDLEKIKRFPKSEARKFLDELLAKRGVHSVSWLYITRISIFTSGKKPIKTLADFQGLKIRGLNPLTDNALKVVGAAPSAMPGSEVYQGLQSGVLDAGLTDISAAVSRRYYEVQKYGTVLPYFTVYFHMYANPKWWQSLKPEYRAAIEAAAAKNEQDVIQITEDTAAAAVGQLRAKGMEITILPPEDVAAWKAKMQQAVIDAFLKIAPQNGPKIIDLINKI
ncbi:MAG TPA: TRAP transporter substrate-binding protein DctP [Alphaproteobacteria bacterium]|jgi:C4-dicarboxylate-binding protein DctP